MTHNKNQTPLPLFACAASVQILKVLLYLWAASTAGSLAIVIAQKLFGEPHGPQSMGNWNDILSYLVGFCAGGGIALFGGSFLTRSFLRLDLSSSRVDLKRDDVRTKASILARLRENISPQTRSYLFVSAGILVSFSFIAEAILTIKLRYFDSLPSAIFAVVHFSPIVISALMATLSKRRFTCLLWMTCLISMIACRGFFDNLVFDALQLISFSLADTSRYLGIRAFLLTLCAIIQLDYWLSTWPSSADPTKSQEVEGISASHGS